jgi:hypothetical protein
MTTLVARLLGHDDYRVMPWKNGKGSTTELAIHPPEAGLEGFDWRVSLADVTADGDFSLFPGYDRSLMVATGRGMELSFEGLAAPQRLPGPGHVAAFSGDWRTHGRLLDGPVRDFNVMTARARLLHECEPIAGGPVEFVWEPELETLFCHCVAGTLVLKMAVSGEWQLEPGQSLCLQAEPGAEGLHSLMVIPHSRMTLGVVVRLRRL